MIPGREMACCFLRTGGIPGQPGSFRYPAEDIFPETDSGNRNPPILPEQINVFI
jgi:hypothetical protein